MCLHLALKRPDDVLEKGVIDGHEYIVMSNGHGYRCGYVKVETGHPLYGRDYDGTDLQCHGGLTFAAPGRPCDDESADPGYWLGFDCAHAGDLVDLSLVPDLKERDFYQGIYRRELEEARSLPWESSVKSTEFVREECRSLIGQIRAIAARTKGGQESAGASQTAPA